MINPIKRVWVPKKAPEPVTTAPAAAEKATSVAKPSGDRVALFDELPSPDMEEKNSDSIWAAFDSVRPAEIERK